MMQGKSTSGEKHPALNADEAEAAADAFRPSWDAGDDDDIAALVERDARVLDDGAGGASYSTVQTVQ